MNASDILKIIQMGEGDRVEFKRDSGSLTKIGRTLCAFSNSTGGVVVIGVDDDGRIAGVDEDRARLQERLTNLLHSGLSVPVSGHCGRGELPAGCVHWIQVPRQGRFEPLRHRGRYWVRRGRSTVEPSPSELQDLFNTFGFVMTEEQVVPAAEEHGIDLRAFTAHLRAMGLESDEGPQPSMTDDLRNRGVIAEFDGQLRPTLYGLLAFGKHPQQYPQTGNFVVRCTAYLGDHHGSEVLSTSESRGRLDEQVLRSLEWVRSFGWGERYEGVIRKDIPLVPQRALREALVNAVVHRDYSIVGSAVMLDLLRDRVLVTSPGSLPNHMSTASVRAGGRPRSRNELMVNAMVAARLMERRGRGWLIMKQEMMRHQRPEPEIEHDREGRTVQVTLWRRQTTPRYRDLVQRRLPRHRPAFDSVALRRGAESN